MMSTSLPGGVWPALFTPLTQDGKLSEPMLERTVEMAVRTGFPGVYLLGATGQGPALSVELRKQVTQRTIKLTAGRLPVMAHVGAISTDDAVELAKHAADCGAMAVSAIPPVYFATWTDVEFSHYTRIASATKLPFLPYFNEFAGAMSLPVKQYVKRLLEVPNVAGIKLTSPNMLTTSLVVAHSEGRLVVYSGCDEVCCQGALSGAQGAIGTTYNFFGPAMIKMRQACVDGQFDHARRFMLTYARVITEVVAGGQNYPFFREAMMIRHGIDIGPGRAPYCAVGKPFEPGKVKAMLEEVDAAAEL